MVDDGEAGVQWKAAQACVRDEEQRHVGTTPMLTIHARTTGLGVPRRRTNQKIVARIVASATTNGAPR